MKKEKIKVTCAFCGKEEYVGSGRAKKYNCCSKECMGKYNSLKYGKKTVKTCPICNENFLVKKSHESIRICCSLNCSKKYRSLHGMKEDNPNYRGIIVELEDGVKRKDYSNYKQPYRRVAMDFLNVDVLPKGYDVHHKDANEKNNNEYNLILLPRRTHMLIHRWFGNILLNAIETEKIKWDVFYSICTEEQANLYKNIEGINVTNQILITDDVELDNVNMDIYKYIKK